MERLTVRKEDGKGTCGMPCFTCDALCGFIDVVFDKLADYEDAEEQGLLLRLPCKVGTPVYMVAQDCGGDTLDCRCMDCEDCRYLYRFVEENAFDTYMCDAVGKTIFLTREEAEKALADMGCNYERNTI